MAIWLEAWSGDNAGAIGGREHNCLLVSLTHTDGTFPSGLIQHGMLGGQNYWFDISVTNLTRGARPAIVTDAEMIGDYVWSLRLAEVDFGDPGRKRWPTGTQLFSVMMLGGGGSQSGAIGTAIIDDDVTRIDATKETIFGEGGWPMKMGRRGRR
jgi:hypothetical protein